MQMLDKGRKLRSRRRQGSITEAEVTRGRRISGKSMAEIGNSLPCGKAVNDQMQSYKSVGFSRYHLTHSSINCRFIVLHNLHPLHLNIIQPEHLHDGEPKNYGHQGRKLDARQTAVAPPSDFLISVAKKSVTRSTTLTTCTYKRLIHTTHRNPYTHQI
jgi:hypothetical protein